MSDDPAYRPDTRIVRAGRRPEWAQRVVNPPVWRASTILFDDVAAIDEAKAGHGKFYYGLHGTPTQWSLAEALTELEPGAAGTMLYSSGLSAISTALLTVLAPGDDVLIVESAYGPTRRLADGFLKKMGIATRYYAPGVGAGIAQLFLPQTRAVLIESPGSQTFELQDVPAICAAARAAGIATILDNTWASPLLFPAMAAGVDISVLACSKYVGGHSDLMLGSATANAEWFPRLERTTFDIGHNVSPDDAWLGARGLRTMAVRLKAQGAATLEVADWLANRPEVSNVLHPARPDFPGHAIYARDFKGSGTVFSFALATADVARRTRFIEALQLFGIGWSWGGYESLVTPVDPGARTGLPWAPGQLVRLQIGLEDVRDLIADLAQALDTA
ncbi:cystathionine beta-lyase [Sphingomonas sp. SUN039]|uniref:cystathionine beta-lyase n=1 Tax=Sphingomonas sp. SUN039 TaxID=2937787 RepID=UPI0021643CFC|nr:cystathionine beta-lyase [Sphingomonas sp. SUN039]UVO55600.1 cystathionine beta-lyase [Sphingomonas sp. SUN039]